MNQPKKEPREDVRRLMSSIDRIDEVYYRVQRVSGLKDSLFVLMYALSNGEPQSQKRISEEWHIPRTTLNTAVLEQVRAGRIAFTASGHKEKLVSLTEEGRAFVREKLAPLFAAENEASSGVDVASLAGELNRFAMRLEEGLSGPRTDRKDES